MAKIEISGSPEELERVAVFLENNNVDFKFAKDYLNHSLTDAAKFDALMERFKKG